MLELYFQTAWSRISILGTQPHINEQPRYNNIKTRWINGLLASLESNKLSEGSSNNQQQQDQAALLGTAWPSQSPVIRTTRHI